MQAKRRYKVSLLPSLWLYSESSNSNRRTTTATTPWQRRHRLCHDSRRCREATATAAEAALVMAAVPPEEERKTSHNNNTAYTHIQQQQRMRFCPQWVKTTTCRLCCVSHRYFFFSFRISPPPCMASFKQLSAQLKRRRGKHFNEESSEIFQFQFCVYTHTHSLRIRRVWREQELWQIKFSFNAKRWKSKRNGNAYLLATNVSHKKLTAIKLYWVNKTKRKLHINEFHCNKQNQRKQQRWCRVIIK